MKYALKSYLFAHPVEYEKSKSDQESGYEDLGVNTDGAPRFLKLENEIGIGGLINTLANLGYSWRKCFRQGADMRLKRSSSIGHCPFSNF
jgi:hypothetical protein